MKFAQPDMLGWLAAVVPLTAILLLAAATRRARLAGRFIGQRLLADSLENVSPAGRRIRLFFVLAALTLLFLALARPQWGFTWEESARKGRDILIALDTSRSMRATDIRPNRMNRARLAAMDLMNQAPSDRIGLVAFAGSAFLQCPLTIDRNAIRQSLEAVDTDIIGVTGSSLAAAIETAGTAFDEESESHRILVLFTDGENHEPGAIEAARTAAAEGLRIFTIGVGTPEGGLIEIEDPSGRTSLLRDAGGNAVRSRLNESLLREIATVGDGFYLPLRGTDAIKTLYDRGLAPLPQTEFSSRFVRRFHERFQLPLALGILLLVLEMFISDRKPEPETAKRAAVSQPLKAAAVALVIPLLCAAASGKAQPDDPPQAPDPHAALLENPEADPRKVYNAGRNALLEKSFSQARSLFDRVLEAEDLSLQQRAWYNLGNTWFREGEAKPEFTEKRKAWETAAKHWGAALKLDAHDDDARHNLTFVRRKLEELEKQQQQQQQQQQQGGDEQRDQEQQQNQEQQNQEQSGREQSEAEKNKQQQSQSENSGDRKGETEGDRQEGESQREGASEDAGDEASQSEQGRQSREAVVRMSREDAAKLLEAKRADARPLLFKPTEEAAKARNQSGKTW